MSDQKFVPKFNVNDYIGNRRISYIPEYQDFNQKDYSAYGRTLWENNTKPERTSFLSKEKDDESQLGDFGVRKYDDLTGRFTAIDPLWEKFYGWSPYMYSANNPVNAVDLDGRVVFNAANPLGATQINQAFDELIKSPTGFRLLNDAFDSKFAIVFLMVEQEEFDNKVGVDNANTEYITKIGGDSNDPKDALLKVNINKTTWENKTVTERAETIGHELEHVRQFLDSDNKNNFKGSNQESYEKYRDDPLEYQGFDCQYQIRKEIKDWKEK